MVESTESTSLRYSESLNQSLIQFKSLLSNSNSKQWKPLTTNYNHTTTGTSTTSTNEKGKSRSLNNEGSLSQIESNSIQVHKRSGKNRGDADIVRAQVELDLVGMNDTAQTKAWLDRFEAVLRTPEVRSSWDKLVEKASTIELLDPQSRISKTDYKLGWPASPRDTITISKTFSDSTTLISIATSLPRSTDEPPFLRPAPPYVRSHVHLLAWCIQIVPPLPSPSSPNHSSPSTSTSAAPLTSTTSSSNQKVKITIFWQWSLKGGPLFSTYHQQIVQLLMNFLDFVREKGDQIPLVRNYGKGLQVVSEGFDVEGECLTVDYSIVGGELDSDSSSGRRTSLASISSEEERSSELDRAIELSLSGNQGWDITLVPKGIGESVELGWKVVVESAGIDPTSGRITVRITHDKIEKVDHLVRVNLSIQRLAGGKSLKVNGEVKEIIRTQSPNTTTFARQLLDDAASIAPSLTDSILSISPSSTTSSPLQAFPYPATHEINALLRRNYIYFTSLLQEPEAKWRHVSESQSVTVTQLNSIDPTLTIYRAEAIFVGIGVWDVFSTICTPGARAQWDKTLEDSTLLSDINELSSLWHLKSKAAWPVAPRDSVTVRTAYKSPSSVHIFSFSTDNTNLFPSIPHPILPTIRTQTDLYGWAIEALSPTTTQITLLDQSDPKGWSNKSWTPTQMVNAVAGVRDFSIKFGGPPVLTRLRGAKATISKYDHEKGSLKIEYKGINGNGGSSNESSISILEDGSRDLVTTIECEIRCDCNTWASSIDIVIDPPPAKVSCLSRHRLSSGGGLWITIEHDSIVVGDERILVTVRKGPSGREKGSVTVNGSKSKVDVEVLEDGEVNLLSKKKRVKASPIPLDQYSTHGPRVPRSVSSQKPTPLPSPPASTNIVDPFKASTTSPTVSPLVKSTTPLAQIVVDEPVVPSQVLPQPPSQALDALSWLQTFHAEQGPELADPAPGWAIHSEKSGTVVRKKIIPRISEVLPVYRGDKIVQGLTADEIASVVSSVGCRKTWDERVDSAIPLTTYGYGCSTAVLLTKPTFPFKGRIFHVASVNAQVRVPSASAASSTSTVMFCATASYSPDESFDQARVNPSGLLSGQVLLEGWILETLDPYASSLFAIPSTRCTYVTCVDYSGSVPLALNSVLNANLARLIGSVESLGKTKGPLPRLWTPDSGLQIEGPLNDDGDQECVWSLSNIDPGSVLLSSDFEVEDGTFRSLFKISAPSISNPTPSTPPRSNSPIPSVMRTPNKSSAVPPLPSHPVGTIFQSDLPRSTSLNFGSPPPKSLMVKASTGELVRKSSSNSLREKRSISPSKLFDAKHSHDLVVAELVVDLKQFPNGYSIACSSSLISLDPTEPLSIEPLVSLAARQIPLRATAHVAPLPPIVSASLDSWKRSNHLVRILVPTSAITHPIQDPLREGKTKPVTPDWFKRLVERGAVVDVRVVPLPADITVKDVKESSGRVMFNGEKLIVASQADSKAVLSRFEDDDDWHPTAAKISRVARKQKTGLPTEGNSSLPLLLQAPVAVAVRLLAPKLDITSFDDLEFPDPKSPGAVTPSDEVIARSPVVGLKAKLSPAVIGRRVSSTSDGANGPLSGLLGAYPLSRLSSTMITTSPVTDDPSTSARRTFTLSFVILVAIISFLLGSLLRSLLTPADYIIYRPIEQQGGHIEQTLLAAFDQSRKYREAIRLLEFRSFFFSKYDIILAAVKR